MRIYAKINKSELVIDLKEKKSNFDGYIEMKTTRPLGDWHAKADGNWHAGNPDIEFEWVSKEMLHIKDQLLLHEDNDRLATATESGWREYRQQLRRWNWDDNTKFPDPKFRPIRPK